MAKRRKSRLEEIARRWTDDAFLVKPSSIPDIVYHYTDAAGLVGMLKTGRIWATDYRFLNDRSEMDHTRKRAKKLINERLSGELKPPLQSFYREIARFLDLDLLGDLFVFSFSEEPDDLSQWRGYAREGLGFTIGFSGQAICEGGNDPKSEYSFFRVEYDHDMQMVAIERALAELEKEFLIQATAQDADLPTLSTEAADWFVWVTNNRSVANKHRSFYSEKEWRIMGVVPIKDRATDVHTRASGLRLVNYIELSLPNKASKKLPIQSIGVGPGFQGTEEADAVRALCERAGYQIDPYFADTPYRRR